MQIAEPARNEGRPRQLDGPLQMFGRGSVVLLLPLQIPEATENIDGLASPPTVPGQPQRLQQCVPGELEVASISKKVSILAQTPGTEKEVKLVLIGPRGVLNAGDAGGDRAAQNDVWI